MLVKHPAGDLGRLTEPRIQGIMYQAEWTQVNGADCVATRSVLARDGKALLGPKLRFGHEFTSSSSPL